MSVTLWILWILCKILEMKWNYISVDIVWLVFVFFSITAQCWRHLWWQWLWWRSSQVPAHILSTGNRWQHTPVRRRWVRQLVRSLGCCRSTWSLFRASPAVLRRKQSVCTYPLPASLVQKIKLEQHSHWDCHLISFISSESPETRVGGLCLTASFQQAEAKDDM